MFGKEKPREIYIPFKVGDPYDFSMYRGQENLKRRLWLRVNAMKRDNSLRGLFFAPAGQGKTAIARALAYEMFKRELIDNYIEVIGTRFETKADVDVFLRRIPPHTLIFIDEIHGLGSGARDAFYPAIQDNVYNFNDGPRMVALPAGLSWLGATTDLGKVHAAMQRRLIPMPLEPLTREDLEAISKSLTVPVTDEAATEMATRCWTPWEIKDELHVTASDLAVLHNKSTIDKDLVLEAATLLGIDKNGLRPKDRAVLACLYKSPRPLKRELLYALSKGALVAMAGIDEPTYTGAIEPKLLRLGYITLRSIGRALTDKALEDYFGEHHYGTFSKANITENSPPTATD